MIDSLKPVEELVSGNQSRFPNESHEYRVARNQLLAAEISLRRQLEAVAAQRRALPPGGMIAQDFTFVSGNGLVRLSELFGDKSTLMIYSMMFGPQRKAPCPMCTSFLNAWNGAAINLRQRVSIAVSGRSPIERLVAFKQERGLANLPFLSDESGDYTRNYVSAGDADIPGFTVFHRSSLGIRHFYSGEMSASMADPGQDPRGAPELDPLWTMLDFTPEGRGIDWYPSLSYRQ